MLTQRTNEQSDAAPVVAYRLPAGLLPCTKERFEEALAGYINAQDGKGPVFSGPYINSSPNGNMFRQGPFLEKAYTLGNETVLLEVEISEAGHRFFVRGGAPCAPSAKK